MWMQGLYVYKALETALYNAFAPKTATPMNYLEEPIRITPLPEEERRAKEEEENEKKLKAFTNYLTQVQKNWEKKHGRSNN